MPMTSMTSRASVAASNRTGVVFVVGVVAQWLAILLPQGTWAAVLRYGGLSLITVQLAWLARAGYVQRRLVWDRESWRRYLVACTFPLAALLLLAASLVALELKLPIIGERGSTTRGVFAAVSTLFLLAGSLGVASAIFWLAPGDPARQFDGPRWLFRRREMGRSR